MIEFRAGVRATVREGAAEGDALHPPVCDAWVETLRPVLEGLTAAL